MIVPHFDEIALRNWVKSANPLDIIVDYENGENLHSPVLHRTCELSKEICWTFKIPFSDREPTNVALVTLDEQRSNFRLKSLKKDNKELALTNDKSWYLTSPCPSPDLFDLRSKLLALIDNEEESSKSVLEIKLAFESGTYGTFVQNILIGFTKQPIFRIQVHVDCVPHQDLARLEYATKSFVSQPHLQYGDVRVKFPLENPRTRDDILRVMYPLPKMNNFYFTHDTLTEAELTPSNYRHRLQQLVRVEEVARIEQVSRYDIFTELHCVSKYLLVSDGDGSTVAKYALPGELFAKITLERECTEDIRSGRLLIRGCDSVYITQMKAPGANLYCPQFEARIEDKCNDSIYVKLSKKCIEELKLKDETLEYFYVQFVLNRVSYCDWQRAIDCLPDARIVFPPSNWNLRPFAVDESSIQLDPRLNSEQRKAVCLMAEPRNILLPPILILGPFGTGKTFTIAQGLKVILENDPSAKIVLCTHSNSAADLYVKEYFGPWYSSSKNPRFKPLRIYYPERAKSTVHREVIKYSLLDNEGNFRYPKNEDLTENDQDVGLIVTTLSTSSCLHMLEFEPTHIVIDEAAQALECEAITPLGLATFDTRLIFAGDQMQLSPEVYSELAAERGFGISLLERLHALYAESHPYRVNLWKNYRAHRDIITLMSELFYGSQLQPEAKNLRAHPEFGSLAFHAVLGHEDKGFRSSGYFNDEEVQELILRIGDLKRDWPTHLWGPYGPGSIGVLAHYKEQVQRVRNALRWGRMSEVSVERVLNVQGKQFTVVFISTVRTRFSDRFAVELDVHDYGFFTNPRLLNTAVTRAKCLVAVVGDPLALLTIGKCRPLWQKYISSSHLSGCSIEELLHDVNAVEELTSSRLNPFAKEFVPSKAPDFLHEFQGQMSAHQMAQMRLVRVVPGPHLLPHFAFVPGF